MQKTLTLQSRWIDDGSKTGQFSLRLYGPLRNTFPSTVRLAYTALVRIPPDTELLGGRFHARTANYHEIAPLSDLQPNETGLLWEILIPVLSHRPAHFTDGPTGAFLVFADGTTIDVDCLPLETSPPVDVPHEQSSPATHLTSDLPSSPQLGLLPQAYRAVISAWSETPPKSFSPAPEIAYEVDAINALYCRLYSQEIAPFCASERSISLHWQPSDPTPAGKVDDTYRLAFGADRITITCAREALQHALISLAQIWHAAKEDPTLFSFPEEGVIDDQPQHGWRGMHLDVSRQLYSTQSILDFLDILAWHKLNRFHWHLTDDEGWRLESLAFPQLTDIGAWRGHGLPLLPQHGSGPSRHGGFFSRDDVKAVLSHARALQIEVVPEIDVPGHCYAALASLPQLRDTFARRGGASVQGYVNNALNPGIPATWDFLEAIFGEAADLFDGPYFHIGGDEVASAAWEGSAVARDWAIANGHLDAEGTPDSMKMQAAILRFVSSQLARAGKTVLAWEEAAKGGGLNAANVILMAWLKAQSAEQLATEGYRVIMCPGEAYYLDMAQSHEWNEPGLSWAGTSSAENSYNFDPVGPLANHKDKLVGIQGCIWSETLISRQRFNHMVFPRLAAIAESAWSDPASKDWNNFAKRAKLMPTMPQG